MPSFESGVLSYIRGNAVVPQQFYPFFAAIAEIEKEAQHERSE